MASDRGADAATRDEPHDKIASDEKESIKSFRDLGVIEPLCEACEKMNFHAPTPIQSQAIPIALEGRDVIGLAQTGSGKTAAFSIPILQALWNDPKPYFACILAPTRYVDQLTPASSRTRFRSRLRRWAQRSVRGAPPSWVVWT